jgi:type IV secretory pathway VirB6-like protein
MKSSSYTGFILLALFTVLFPAIAAAQCVEMTADAQDMIFGEGIIAGILELINNILAISGEQMYNYIIDNDTYRGVLFGMVLLTISVFGAMIVFDMIRPTPGTVLTKLVTLGVVVWLLSPNGGWDFFNNIVVHFFLDGMNELISIFSARAFEAATGVAVSAPGGGNPDHPMWVLNVPFGQVISSKFMLIVQAILVTGPFGWALGLMMIWAGFNLVMAIISAVFIYIKSLVGLWFLFGLAPIFLITMLFERTRRIFEGWLNLIIYLSFLPVLTFSFLLFFLIIVTGSLSMILETQVAWGRLEILAGSPANFQWWRFCVDGSFEGPWTQQGYHNTGVLTPIPLIDILFFLLSSYIAWQYTEYVSRVARELTGTGLNLGSSTRDVRGWFETRGWTPDNAAGQAISRTGSFIDRARNAIGGR